MNTVPEPVVTYLDGLENPCELNGYLCLYGNGKIVDGAGMVGELNLGELDKTKSAVLSVPFLEGLLPPALHSPTVISNVHIDDNHYFDIHLLNDDDAGYWVLFVDSTRSGKQLQEEQQVRLDVDFINDKRKKVS